MEKKSKEKCHLCSNVALSLYNIVTICIEKEEPLFGTMSKLKKVVHMQTVRDTG